MDENDSKAKILQGATELFLRYGIRSVSMDNIANHLGVSKKTIYQYFKDKDEMVNSVTANHIQKDKSELDWIAENSKNAVEELVNLTHCLRENFREMNPSLLFDLQKYHHKSWALWIEYKSEHIKNQIVRSLNQGKEEGYFRADLNTEILARMRLETIQLAFDPSVFPADQFDLTTVQMQGFEHFIYGLFTDKGRKLYEKYKLKMITKDQSTIKL
ncbi:MAG: TetR/AcrR family transcriptional regulator [Cyclobacteriaceae bacterium]